MIMYRYLYVYQKLKMKKSYYQIDRHFELIKKSENKSNKELKKNNLKVANYLNIGYYLLTPIIIGIFIGKVIDNWLKTNFFLFLMLILGVIGTFYNLYKIYIDERRKNH